MISKPSIKICLEALVKLRKKYCVDGNFFDRKMCDTEHSKIASKKMGEIRNAIAELESLLQENDGRPKTEK
jgi:hypothetical protein